MDKNYYFVATKEENGKFASFCMKIHGSNNLVGKFDGLKTVNICSSKKEAEMIAAYWNASYKKNGTYLYD